MAMSAEAFGSLCLEDEVHVQELSDKYAVLIEVEPATTAADGGAACVVVVRNARLASSDRGCFKISTSLACDNQPTILPPD